MDGGAHTHHDNPKAVFLLSGEIPQKSIGPKNDMTEAGSANFTVYKALFQFLVKFLTLDYSVIPAG